MDKKEIKRANRRALPKFILVLVIAMIVGWTGGYLSGKFRMDAFAESIRNTGAFFGTHIAPWLTVAVAVIVPAIYYRLVLFIIKLQTLRVKINGD